MPKIVKWELFFVFSDGERESMWEINKIPGKNLFPHETKELDDHSFGKTAEFYPFVMIATYNDGVKKEI